MGQHVEQVQRRLSACPVGWACAYAPILRGGVGPDEGVFVREVSINLNRGQPHPLAGGGASWLLVAWKML
jgi:hypothetical protein